MPAVVCLIANPLNAPLPEARVAAVARAVKGEARVLARATAVEIETDICPDRGLLLQELDGAAIDLAVIDASCRRKRLLVADMDSTMITIECIDEVADFAGIKAEVAAVTRQAMNGEIDFVAALRARVALLAGLPVTVIEEVIAQRLRFVEGAATLVRTMRAHGAKAALVSGGFTSFTGHVRENLGFDLDEANVLEVEGGRLTGRLSGPIRDASAKLATLLRLRATHGLAHEETLAVGDGANDLPMLGAAGLGVAFRAHPRVEAAAPVAIRHGDLTALLYLQGYAREEFVAA